MGLQPRFVLNAIILAIVGAGLAVYLLAVWKGRLRVYASIAPVGWLIHALIFYAVIVARAEITPTVFFTVWSSILRLQAAITILAIGVGVLWRNGHTY